MTDIHPKPGRKREEVGERHSQAVLGAAGNSPADATQAMALCHAAATEALQLSVRLLKKYGLTQTEVARQLGITQGYLAQILGGTKRFPVDKAAPLLHSVVTALHQKSVPGLEAALLLKGTLRAWLELSQRWRQIAYPMIAYLAKEQVAPLVAKEALTPDEGSQLVEGLQMLGAFERPTRDHLVIEHVWSQFEEAFSGAARQAEAASGTGDLHLSSAPHHSHAEPKRRAVEGKEGRRRGRA